MKLKVDDQGRLPALGLLLPNATIEATLESDGSIRLVQLTQVPVLRPCRIEGRLRGAEISIDRERLAAAIRAERDAR